MAEIHEEGALGQHALTDRLPAMADEELMAQDLVQQGAIHAVSYLLTNGCNEETATMMLQSLRANSKAIRDEAARRGNSSPFDRDQTVFH